MTHITSAQLSHGAGEYLHQSRKLSRTVWVGAGGSLSDCEAEPAILLRCPLPQPHGAEMTHGQQPHTNSKSRRGRCCSGVPSVLASVLTGPPTGSGGESCLFSQRLSLLHKVAQTEHGGARV